MIPEKQLEALLHLLDDPDEEVADAVISRILSLGSEVIPQLEKAWECSEDETYQGQLETLIQRVHFEELCEDFRQWNNEEDPGLLQGALLISRYAYPGLKTEAVLAQFERVRLNAWLETNTYLAPIEQINALNSILYGYYRFLGTEVPRNLPASFFLNVLLDGRQGNAFTLGILYLVLCERLDIPLFAVSIPQQFLLAYIDTYQPAFANPADDDLSQHIRFYVDPANGNVYSPFDVTAYLHKTGAPSVIQYYIPLSSRQIMRQMMDALARAYEKQKKSDQAAEVRMLRDLIQEEPEVDF